MRQLYNIVVFIISRLSSVRNILVFESHSDFCDNSKALFDKAIQNKLNKKYKIYWFVENIDYFTTQRKIDNVVYININTDNFIRKTIVQLRADFILLQCKYYFYSHRNFSSIKPKKGQIFLNLTHGVPLKDISNIYNSQKDSYIATTSIFSSELMKKSYNSNDNKIKILGYPRNDFIFRSNKNLSLFKDKKIKKKIIWLPTYRRHKNGNKNDTGTTNVSDLPILENEEDIIKVNNYLVSNEILLIIKPHPAQDLKFFRSVSTTNITIIDNDYLLRNDIELYELLAVSDGLITDYSSVYIDYLLTNNPIAFTVDDFTDYSTVTGFSVKNPLKYMPGPKLNTIDDMISFIESVSTNKDVYINERKKLCNLFHEYHDNNSSERTLEYFGLLNKKESLNTSWTSYNIIAHAAGSIEEKIYTNSQEAFEINYRKGYKLFEIDITLSADNKVIARHDWLNNYGQFVYENRMPVSKQEFMDNKYYNKFTPLDLEKVINLMRKYPDVYIILDGKTTSPTDTYELYEKINKKIEKFDKEIKNRFIPQMFYEQDLITLNNFGFKEVLYVIGREAYTPEYIVEYCKRNNIKAVSLGKKIATKEFLELLSRNGIMSYIYTLNKYKEIQKLLKRGAYGYFSDLL